MNPLRHIKPAVRQVAAYTLAARSAAVKINQNENPYDLPESVKRRVLEGALSRPWSRYPEFDPRALLAKLAAFAGWKADGILAGNGSNAGIRASGFGQDGHADPCHRVDASGRRRALTHLRRNLPLGD